MPTMIYKFFIHALAFSLIEGAVIRRWSNGGTPDGTVDPGAAQGCQYWANSISPSDECGAILSYFDITEEQFLAWNPSLGDACESRLEEGHAYCVAAPPPKPTPSFPNQTSTTGDTTTTSPSTSTLTSASPTSTVPSPTQPGLTPDCTKFYKVKPGDNCYDIAKTNGISQDDFNAWNPAVGDTCAGLWGGYYVCIGTKATVPSTISTTTASTSTGSPGPSPTQPGIINTCTNFYQAVSGDNCDVIVNQKFKTFTLEDFIAWNPAVKSDCSGLWRGYYYCTGVPGTPTKPITTGTPKPTANPMNPQPQQPGRVKNCNKFYLVKNGDNCYNIEQKFSLSHNNFVRWNPDVKDDCSSLWQGYHMCVGVQGQPTRTSTTSAPQPTAHEPLYPGTIKECKNYHLVKSGDTCWSLQQSYNLDENKFKTLNPVLASDCSKLWLGYYICLSA
ncbi:hypothetical protein MaudMau93_004334 [Microsporum audouinii]